MPVPDAPREPQRTATGFGESAQTPRSPRAEPPRPPALPRRFQAAEDDRRREHQGREAAERRSILRGLLWIAVAVLVLAVLQFGWGRAFPAGGWRRW